MSSAVNVSGLELNPKELEFVADFIIERAAKDPELNRLVTVYDGVKMKQQVVLAAQMGLTGIADTTCTRPNSGAASVLTQKYFEPANIGDTLAHCNTDLNSLFKAYYNKVEKYIDLFEISNVSDFAVFIAILFIESKMKSVQRYAWLGDTDAAASEAAVAGLKVGTNAKYFNVVDGYWKQIFTGVTATTIAHSTVKTAALNALTSTATQVALAAGDSVAIFEDLYAKASSQLRAEVNAYIAVTREIFDNYRIYLQGKGENFTIEYTVNGMQSLKWNGLDIINMENVWDTYNRAYFEQDSTDNAYWLPNRAIYTIPENLALGTLNRDDFEGEEVENWYDQTDRINYFAYGYTLAPLVLENDMIVVSY